MGRSQRPKPKGFANLENDPSTGEIICRCNSVSRKRIENAILKGADTMNKIFDRTTAGVGPCGGSCRRKLQPLLEHYLEHGEFPDKITPDQRGKPKKGN